MILPIYIYGSTVLRNESEDITPDYPDLSRFVADLWETMYEADGVGLAAPQVGILKRVVAVQRYDKEGAPFEVYPNIRITEYSAEKQTGREGCLSVPDTSGIVERAQSVVISYTCPQTLETVNDTVQGYTAVIFQHETDHLDGVLYTDKLYCE